MVAAPKRYYVLSPNSEFREIKMHLQVPLRAPSRPSLQGVAWTSLTLALCAVIALWGLPILAESSFRLSLALSAAALLLIVWLTLPGRILTLFGIGVFLLPITTARALGPFGNLADAFFLCAFAALLVRDLALRGELRLIRPSGLALSLVLFLAAGVVASFRAVNGTASFLILLKIVFAAWILPNLMACVASTVKSLRILTWVYLCGAASASVSAIADAFAHTDFQHVVTGSSPVLHRYAGITGHPSTLGAVAALGIAAGVGLYLSGSTRAVGALPLASVCVGGILVSASLTGLFAAAGGVLAALWFGGRRRLARGLLLGTVLGATVLLAFTSFQSGHLLLISRLSDNPFSSTHTNISQRGAANAFAIQHIRDQPFLGAGLDQVGTGPTHVVHANPRTGTSVTLPPVIHNLWLQIWYTAGILGFFAFGLYYVKVLRMRRTIPPVLGIPLGGMIIAWLIDMLDQPDLYSRYGLFAAAAIIAASRPEIVKSQDVV
jgi:O-antigen ligase